jgi:hypothetical protein
VAAWARHLALVRTGRVAPQQLAQSRRSGPVHRGAHRHLDCFQIESARVALVLKDKTQQNTYFAFDFLPDRFRRFFSCDVRVSSTGLARQIFSLVSIKVRLRS